MRARCANATICLDAFHIVKWCTDALDEVRRETWNDARRGGMRAHARDLKGARYIHICGYVVLEDDLHFQQAGNITPVIRTDKLDDEAEALINKVGPPSPPTS